jgi:phosphatidylglycerol:prolipoprotein diacylglycerol transferase
MVDQSYLHQLDPFAIQITESLGLRWYGLAYITGFLVAWAAIRWMGKKKITPIQPNKVGDLMFAAVIGVLIGGRLGYCLFYAPSMIYTFTNDFPWWKLLAIQDGGMASHGGIIGVAVAFVIWGKRNNIPTLHLFDIGAMFATPGLFFGRIANFVNGELWGRPLPPEQQLSPPTWSVKYPTEITEVWLQNPSEFQAELLQLETLQTSIIGGSSYYQTIVNELYAGNQTVVEVVKPLLTAWYPSQIFQALAEGPLLFLTLFIVWWTPKKPGIIAGSFLLFYGSARVATEVFRQPDEGVALFMGLSRGQVLSLFMIMFGLLLLFYTSRRKTPMYGGFKLVNINSTTK